MIKLERKERPGDRSRKRISLPREGVIPMFNDGMMTVEVAHEASARRLVRKGYSRIPTGGQAPTTATKPTPTDSAPAIADMGIKALIVRKGIEFLRLKVCDRGQESRLNQTYKEQEAARETAKANKP